MKRLKSLFGYARAFAALVVVLGTFIGLDRYSRTIAEATGIDIHPRFSGGEILRIIDHGEYHAAVHRPVYDGLFGPGRHGFVQIDWGPAYRLPDVIREALDYDADGIVDLHFSLNTITGEADLSHQSRSVLGLEKAVRLKNGWAIRILLDSESSLDLEKRYDTGA